MKLLAANRPKPIADRCTRASNQLHQPRHQRDQQELRHAGPGQHLADLLGIVALHLREIERQDEDRAVERDAEQDVREGAEAEIAAQQQAQVEQRLLRRELDDQRTAVSATAAITAAWR